MALFVRKPVEWIGTSKADLLAFPDSARRVVGYALYQAQIGLKHPDAKPLRGTGSQVLEVVSRHDGDSYRAVYTFRFGDSVYVLHAFKKKSKRGIATPKREIELIRRRLKVAEQHHRANYGKR